MLEQQLAAKGTLHTNVIVTMEPQRVDVLCGTQYMGQARDPMMGVDLGKLLPHFFLQIGRAHV